MLRRRTTKTRRHEGRRREKGILGMGVMGMVALLGGCMVGPNYKRPDVEVPGAWREAADASGKVPAKWWTIFDDPVLNDLEERAASENQTLAQAAGRVLEGEAVYRINGSYLYPTVTFDPSYRRERQLSAAGISGGGGTETGTGAKKAVNPYITRNDFLLPFNLSYEVDLWGRIRRNVEAAKNQLVASQNDYAFVKLGLESQVAETYISLRAVDLQRQVLREAVELYSKTLHLVQAQYRNGVASELEIDQAETQLASVQSSLTGYDQTRDQYEHLLAQLTGRPAPEVVLGDRPLGATVPEMPAALPSTLLERRPDVVEAERLLAAANARVGVATANFYPALDLIGLGGLESIHASDVFMAGSRIWSVGPSISMPIFEGGRLVATLDQNKAQYAQAEAAYRQNILTAFQEVEDALSGIRVLGRQAEDQQRLVEAAGGAAHLADLRYREGIASFLDVITAQQALLTAQQNANEILRQRLLSNVLLIRALGGGWNGAAVQDGAK